MMRPLLQTFFKALGGLRATLVLSTLGLSGCDTLAYFGQAASGQWQILHSREPITALLEAPDTDPTLKHKLTTVLEARAWAERELLLNSGDAYTEYVALDRPYVVWNVFAAPEFSVTPQQWCFPIAGCVAYRGYFSEQAAQRYAQALRRQGFDTYVGGVDAYSTLGWFDDPVLSSFVRRSDTALVALVFHELAHRTLYAKNDSTFNESYATLVEQEGVRRWLEARQQREEWERYQEFQRYRGDFVDLVLTYRAQLEALYASVHTESEKRAKKQALAEHTRERYRQLRDTEWQGYNGYDRWMSGELNNAQVSTIATYHAYVPAFQSVLRECRQDMACFHDKARALAALEPEARKAALETLMPAGKTENTR